MFLKGRICSECGSSLVQKYAKYREPHCFVCGFNEPTVPYPSKGFVWQLLPKLNFNPAHYGMKTVMVAPAVVFMEGYAYKAQSIFSGTLKEDKWETLEVRRGRSSKADSGTD